MGMMDSRDRDNVERGLAGIIIGCALAIFVICLCLAADAIAAGPPNGKACNDQPAPRGLTIRMMQQRTACRAYRDGRSMAEQFGGMELTNWGAEPRSCHLMSGPPERGEVGRGFCIGYVTMYEEEDADRRDTDWHCSVPMIHVLKRDERWGSVITTFAGDQWRCVNDSGTETHEWPSSDGRWPGHGRAGYSRVEAACQDPCGTPRAARPSGLMPQNPYGEIVYCRFGCINPIGCTAGCGRRHNPPVADRVLWGGPLTKQDNERINLTVARRCNNHGRPFLFPDGAPTSNGDGAWQWYRAVSWPGRGVVHVVGLISSGYWPIITSAPGCRR